MDIRDFKKKQKTIYVCCSDLTFSYSVFLWELLSAIPGVLSPQRPLCVYVIIFPCIIIFTSVLADGSILESELQQVSSSLLNSHQYSGRSQKCCSLDSFHTSRYFQVLQFLYCGDCSKNTNYNWHNRHFHVPRFFQSSINVEILILLLVYFQFYLVVHRNSKVHNPVSSLLFVDYYYYYYLIFTQPLRSGRIWHKVNF